MLPRLARPAAFVAAGAVLCTVEIYGAGRNSSDAPGPSRHSVDAQQPGDTQHEINTLLDQYTQALLKKDVAALDRIWADDLTFINPRGELLSKQDRLDNIKTGATAFKSSRLSDTRIRTYGQAAVATFKVALEAQYSGQDGSGDYRVTTVWARPKGTWQMVAVHMTPVVK
jgi:ketosteroid isomerase-like protein